MLIFVSDLHFRDGTAGEHNLSPRALERVLEDWAASAANAKAKEVKIVFLGDIFDLLRTEMWFDVPLGARPWGCAGSTDALEAQAEAMLDAILHHPVNRKTFALLRGRLAERFPDFPVEPERIYVPGNHDRLCAQFPALLRKAQKALGGKPGPALHAYHNPRYGVIARHGQENDPFNYEGGDSLEDADYLRVPIGDAIVVELVTRLPRAIMSHPEIQALPRETQRVLKRNLQQIENVRPLSAVLYWLFYQVQRQEWLQDVIEEAVDHAAAEFHNLPFVKNWLRRHDRFLHPLDEADQLQAALLFLDKVRVTRLKRLFPLADGIRMLLPDSMMDDARKEFSRLGADIAYVVYGHTHVAAQIPVQTDVAASGETRERVYLNAGAWGTRHIHAAEGGFVSWNQLTYTIFYDAEESLALGRARRGVPTFETWTGTVSGV